MIEFIYKALLSIVFGMALGMIAGGLARLWNIAFRKRSEKNKEKNYHTDSEF